MAFRHHTFKPIRFAPVPVMVDLMVSNFDDNGVEHVSYTSVSAVSVINSMPLREEVTLLSQMQSGSLKPVPLDDFQSSDMDANVASNIINSLNVSDNENS